MDAKFLPRDSVVISKSEIVEVTSPDPPESVERRISVWKM